MKVKTEQTALAENLVAESRLLLVLFYYKEIKKRREKKKRGLELAN